MIPGTAEISPHPPHPPRLSPLHPATTPSISAPGTPCTPQTSHRFKRPQHLARSAVPAFAPSRVKHVRDRGWTCDLTVRDRTRTGSPRSGLAGRRSLRLSVGRESRIGVVCHTVWLKEVVRVKDWEWRRGDVGARRKSRFISTTPETDRSAHTTSGAGVA